jgi:drug/metabolite transporter (DMT)-like permease
VPPDPSPAAAPDAPLGGAAGARTPEQRALLQLVIASLCFGLMAFAAKLAAGRGLGGAQVAAVRFAFGLLPVALLPEIRRRALAWERRDLLLYRGVFGGTAVLLYFLAIEHVTVGLATLLNYTSPVFAVLFASLFIGEKVQARVLPALGAALLGVFLVVRAGAAPGELRVTGPWVAAGLLSAILSGAALTAIRMARRTEGSWAIYTSFNGIGLALTLPPALLAWRAPDPVATAALLGVGVASMAAQLLMTHAYRWVDNLRAGVVSQLAVFVAMALGVSLLGDRVTPLALLGSLLTVVGVVAVVAARSPSAAVAVTEPPEP